ncbi:hypothetical protein KHC23_07620 [Ancylobacter dichloromethanicus]|uniref:Uncharacterized protein n=1 Tax=Ancylobacter dichloromethanicus TaxID=518825 RepID=A0A9W6J896_9HYPH|nr:hypothetical protein [Ancylobacter dichloromethanicus]MBS7553514.1 hypothetical protein [Ancylobacter dichloromethanicus]GLK72572.1 hypothetical protein GCM10017643_26880 [Ancylobacter dichloromethanicus]
MSVRDLDPAIAEDFARMAAAYAKQAGMEGIEGIHGRLALAFAEPATLAIFEETLRRSDRADLVQAVTTICCTLMVNALVYASKDPRIVCSVAKHFHEMLREQFEAAISGKAEGLRVMITESGPFEVTRMGTPS